jgi:hypothetical protein
LRPCRPGSCCGHTKCGHWYRRRALWHTLCARRKQRGSKRPWNFLRLGRCRRCSQCQFSPHLYQRSANPEFPSRNHAPVLRGSWVNITGVDVNGGISIHEDHTNLHGDPPWPLPLPLPFGKGDAPTGPPQFSNILFQDFVLSNVTRSSSVNFAILPQTLKNLTLRRVNLQPIVRDRPSLGISAFQSIQFCFQRNFL